MEAGGGGEEGASPSFRRDTPVRSLLPSAASFPNDIREGAILASSFLCCRECKEVP